MTAFPYVPFTGIEALLVFFAWLVALTLIVAFFSVGRHRDDVLRYEGMALVRRPVYSPATYEKWAELSIMHADPDSPEVAVVHHIMDEEREIDLLRSQHRMVTS